MNEDFFRDLCKAWEAMGQPALMAIAWMNPGEFVRVVASLIPKEPEATMTPVMELNAIIAEGLQSGLDPAAMDEDAQIIQ